MKKLIHSTLGIAALLALGTSHSVVAQQDIDEAYEIVDDQLDAAREMISDLGLDREIEKRIFEMNGEDVQDFDIELRGGVVHAVLAVCDSDCSDVDVAIYDYDGDLIDSDIEFDDVAVISGETPYSGSYVIQVSVADCSAEPCITGYAVYSE